LFLTKPAKYTWKFRETCGKRSHTHAEAEGPKDEIVDQLSCSCRPEVVAQAFLSLPLVFIPLGN